MKLKMMSRDGCRWSSSAAHSAVCQSVREATTLPGVWIMQPPPDWQTPLNGIILTSERGLITMQKQLEGTQKYINEQCR